jgi:flagellar motor switch protein FliG
LIIEKFERDLDMTINVRVKDVEAAQWGMLEKMEEVKECM